MKKLTIGSIAIILALATGTTFAQSAKFAAIWTDGPRLIGANASCDTSIVTSCLDTEETTSSTLANIKVPNNKELLVGVSAQIGLVTSTIVRGKKGSESRAYAMAEGGVKLIACNWNSAVCYDSAPGGYLTLNNREQDLSAILGGIIETCTFDVTLDVVDDEATGNATWDLDDCIVEQEEIALTISTLSANHFNFVFPNLPQGDYSIIAEFAAKAKAIAEELDCPDTSDFCAPGDGDAEAVSHAFVGKTMVTVQEVRAVNGELGEPVVID